MQPSKNLASQSDASSKPRDVWTIGRLLQWAQRDFAKRHIPSARLDAELLLADALGEDRLHLYVNFDKPVGQNERERFRASIQRRRKQEPVAYILGYREFYGRNFIVDPRVLIPRPETEHLVDAVLSWHKQNNSEQELQQEQATPIDAPQLVGADVCAGSGAIGLSLLAEIPSAKMAFVDIQPEALQVAKHNAEALDLTLRATFYQGDLLAPIAKQTFDFIVANPPYVAPSAKASLPVDVVDFEPAAALFADNEGLALLFRLIDEAPKSLRLGGALFCECGFDQAAQVATRFAQRGFSQITQIRDLSGHPRVVLGISPGAQSQ